jgi:hypothetical protein
MRLEIEELNGPRMLNYRFIASDQGAAAEYAANGDDKKTVNGERRELVQPRPLASAAP